MPRDIYLQPAYLLHSRPFRDSSLLLDFLTRDYGRVRAVGKGVRRARSSSRGLLQPFTPLQVSFAGKLELKTLRQVELLSGSIPLRGQQLFSALYINELITRLVQGHEAEASLFAVYESALNQLSLPQEGIEPVLRRFEITLLEALGYGIEFGHEVHSGELIQPDGYYCLELEGGFSRVEASLLPSPASGARPGLFPGKDLLCMEAGDFSAADTRRTAKQILRQVLAVYLGDKPLQSRQLFSSGR